MGSVIVISPGSSFATQTYPKITVTTSNPSYTTPGDTIGRGSRQPLMMSIWFDWVADLKELGASCSVFEGPTGDYRPAVVVGSRWRGISLSFSDRGPGDQKEDASPRKALASRRQTDNKLLQDRFYQFLIGEERTDEFVSRWPELTELLTTDRLIHLAPEEISKVGVALLRVETEMMDRQEGWDIGVEIELTKILLSLLRSL